MIKSTIIKLDQEENFRKYLSFETFIEIKKFDIEEE